MYFLKLRWFSTSSLRFKFPVYDISLAKYSLYLIITSHLPLILSFLCISQCHTLTFFLSLGNTETVYYLADTFCDKLHENYTGDIVDLFKRTWNYLPLKNISSSLQPARCWSTTVSALFTSALWTHHRDEREKRDVFKVQGPMQCYYFLITEHSTVIYINLQTKC